MTKAKREADDDLNRDNYASLVDAEGSETPGTFKKASEEAIQKRVIKMPKSKVTGDQPSGLFAGAFGTPAVDQKPAFSFATPAVNPFQTSSSTPAFQFSAKPAAEQPFKFAPKAETSLAEPELTATLSKPLIPATPKSAEPVVSETPKDTKPNQDKLKLLASKLRGLNNSLLNSIKKEFESNCFFDATDLLNQYSKHRNAIVDSDKESYEAVTCTTSVVASSAPVSTPVVATPAKPTTTFGSSSTPAKTSISTPAVPFSFASPTTSAPTTASPTAFGTSAPTTTATFGTSATFTFGTPLKPAVDSAFAKPVLSFNPPAATAFTQPKQESMVENEDDDEEAQNEPQATQLTVGDEETQDETLYEIRAKLSKTAKTDDGQVKWVSIGLGALKLNLHKESGRKRLLMRADGTGRLVLNSSLFPDMKVSIEQSKYVAFTAFIDGKLAKIYAMVKTPELANELKTAIENALK